MSRTLRYLAPGVPWASVGFILAIPLLIWGSDKAPEFYGSFTAAIVAAVAVIAGTYYQADLARRREDEIARRDRIAEALDLFVWLEHAVGEMEFIAGLLERFAEDLGDDDTLQMSLERYREMVSAKFMDELRDRAKSAARLSPALAGIVAPILYDTFLKVDRIYRFRGASDHAKFGRAELEKHLFITRRRIEKLEEAQDEIGKFLAEFGSMPALREAGPA